MTDDCPAEKLLIEGLKYDAISCRRVKEVATVTKQLIKLLDLNSRFLIVFIRSYTSIYMPLMHLTPSRLKSASPFLQSFWAT